MVRLIAHVGEVHSNAGENTTHWLESWYLALPLFILIVIGFGSLVYLLSRRSVATTYLSVVAVLLVSGVLFYDKSPIISVISIAIGLFGSLVTVLMFLSSPDNRK